MPPSPIQFTQEQARSLARLSVGDLRQWRKAVPYLAAKPGKSARFTFADLVGLALTQELITVFGVHISTIGRSVDALFRLLADGRPAHLDGMVALIGTDDVALLQWSDIANRPTQGPKLVVPCDPLIARMGQQMLPVPLPLQQAQLPFPPHMIRSGA